MLAIRQAGDETIDIYGETFLIERPMLAALRAPDSTVLLIDEIDRSDQEFEAFLLEFLSDFQISIPERGPSGRPSGRRGADLEPHARSARGTAPALRLSLDRLPDGGARSENHHDTRLQRRRGDRACGCRRRRQTKARASEQGARRRRGRRIGRRRRRCSTRAARAGGCVQALDRRCAEDEEDLAFIAGRLDALIAEAAA